MPSQSTRTSRNVASLQTGVLGASDALQFFTRTTQQDDTLGPGDGILFVRAIDRAVTMRLPAASTVSGRAFIIMKLDHTANAVRISSAQQSDKINGVRTIAITTQFGSRTLVSDGINWWVVNQI